MGVGAFSDETARCIDSEVRALIEEAQRRAHEILSSRRSSLDALATALQEREVMDRAQVESLLRAPAAQSLRRGGRTMTDESAERHTGQCLCGGVTYLVSGALREVVACHCSQCRRTSGHYVAATSAPAACLRITSSGTLTWYRSSASAERGFCNVCGGNLFWRQIGDDSVSIMAGTLDPPTRLHIAKHIFVGDKSDYYALHDDAPQLRGWT